MNKTQQNRGGFRNGNRGNSGPCRCGNRNGFGQTRNEIQTRNESQARNENLMTPEKADTAMQDQRPRGLGNGKGRFRRNAAMQNDADMHSAQWQKDMGRGLRRRLRDGSCLNRMALQTNPAPHSSLAGEDATAGSERETPCT